MSRAAKILSINQNISILSHLLTRVCCLMYKEPKKRHVKKQDLERSIENAYGIDLSQTTRQTKHTSSSLANTCWRSAKHVQIISVRCTSTRCDSNQIYLRLFVKRAHRITTKVRVNVSLWAIIDAEHGSSEMDHPPLPNAISATTLKLYIYFSTGLSFTQRTTRPSRVAVRPLM